MTDGDNRARIRAAVTAARDCAETMDAQAASLLEALSAVPMDAELRSTAATLCTALTDTAGRVSFELALLATDAGKPEADASDLEQRLVDLDATMMGALAPVAELADRLETAAERDESNERAFVLVIEAAGLLLQALEKARAATAALDAAKN